MSSFYEDASLVMIPSGYKTSKVYCAKPTDGTGDLTFTRSNDTATRVASNGLIEKVRTNLATYSSDFSTAGLTVDATISTNTTTDPFGTTLADSLLEAATTGNHLWYRDFTVSNGTELTFSIYVKSIGGRNVRVAGSTGTGSELAVVDLANGSILASIGAVSVTSAGSGWYRISVTTTTTGTTARFIVYAADGTSISYAGNTSKGIYLFGHQVEYGVMTDYIATTTAAVSVGPVANVPRLDYLNSSCPKLLLEPQRTNLLLQSNTFTTTWAMFTGPAVTPNSITSPEGYTNATTLNSSGGTNDFLYQGLTGLTVSTTYTFSFYVKNLNSTSSRVWGPAQADAIIGINWTGATLSSVSGAGASFTSVGNGWYRVVVTGAATMTTPNIRIYADTTNTSKSVYIYGTQFELGSYATSYIPTLGASVTRGEDAALKTGISSLIGQTEGTLFADFFYVGNTQAEIIDVSDGTENNRIMFYVNSGSLAQAYVTNGGTTDGFIASSFNIVAGTEYKIAIGYKANDLVLYINGTQIGTDTSLAIPATSKLTISNGGAGNYPMASRVAQALLFKTRLSNSELASLTA